MSRLELNFFAGAWIRTSLSNDVKSCVKLFDLSTEMCELPSTLKENLCGFLHTESTTNRLQ